MQTVLVTGSAGFIGANLVLNLVEKTGAMRIVGIDSLNDYYDVSLKRHRLDEIRKVVSKY